MSAVSHRTDTRPIGLPWLQQVPSQWSVRPLKFNLKLMNEPARTSDQLVALENIEGWTGRFLETGSSFDGQGAGFEANDVLFGKLRPNLAKVFIADRAGEAFGDLWVLRPQEGCHPRFFFYQLLGSNFIDTVSASTNGAKMPRADWSYVGALPSPTPMVDEQRAIATYLDRETARIDGLIEKKARFIALLKEKRVAVIAHAVTKGLNRNAPMKDSGQAWLGEVPAHWEVVPSIWLFTESKERAHEDDEQLSATQKYGVIPLSEFERLEQRQVTKAFLNLEQRKHVEVGDFVISMRSMDGGLERAKARGCVRSSYVVLKSSSEVDVDFFTYLFKSISYIQALRATSSFIRDGQDLNFWNFRAVKLPRLPLDEQAEIARFLSNETARIDTLITKTEQSIALLKEKRAALITAAVTGKIDVRSAA